MGELGLPDFIIIFVIIIVVLIATYRVGYKIGYNSGKSEAFERLLGERDKTT